MGESITKILETIDRGDAGAARALLPLVYNELRTLAAQRLAREAPGQTLQATALVHEAYFRLAGPDSQSGRRWDSRGHFFAAAAEAMRRILIDRARARRGPKRGGDRKRFGLDLADLSVASVPDELLDLDAALTKLAAEDPVKSELVKLRFFGGMNMDEAAGFLGISATTADRYWAYARAWLYHEMVQGWEKS
ncbi:MAG TPA: sigma-70 family RNA polymerase sigma factor [Phycisphaerae bacterium]|nr:sigma-70 family RNA polymerase sigma factor [Phycisphaerae bacterium]